MNFKIIAFSLLSAVVLSSCSDCLDCQSSTDLNLTVEYYSAGTLDSVSTVSYSGEGYVNTTLPNSILLSDDFSSYLSPVSIRETCGQELKDINNSSISFETVTGDSSALFKYSWTESWECK
ncbi:hypothetical protein N9Y90_00135 [Flavobacteriales bacterium]|jgi:hypothetical protein|nr:hypothetical protein [Flavobacteriales bacterium]MDB2674926.1 hypothetical protein [Flavobacteriales bacterium]